MIGSGMVLRTPRSRGRAGVVSGPGPAGEGDARDRGDCHCRHADARCARVGVVGREEFPAGVPVASIRPPTALPMENPTLRTTWLKLIALDVSLFGVTARMTAGIAAEKLPTPKPRIAIDTNTSVRFERAPANRAKAPSTTMAVAARSAGPPIRSRR